MKAYRSLPEGYQETLQINLQKDKKTSLRVNLGGALAMVIVFLLGHFIVPVTEFKALMDLEGGAFFLRFGALLAGYVAYIVLHELTHAAAMKAVGGGRVVFGFTGVYAFAGSHEDYFDKNAYHLVALSPLVVWGVIFGALALLLPGSWFWVVWFLQAGNIGGSAGDVYVTLKLLKRPATILVRDTGVDMTVYDNAK